MNKLNNYGKKITNFIKAITQDTNTGRNNNPINNNNKIKSIGTSNTLARRMYSN